ncbi:component of SufBCD complex [Plastorhodobacter daqingensis]|uniref:Component of SufBCD complex n=1 Tax=Plastorhodobacter daqingensis TaxID=1387281 RepID=A0ABW2UK82_9RHOB
MSLYQHLYEVLDTRSFTTLWYWIALLAFWYLAGVRVLGIPYDMVLQARRDATAQAALAQMAALSVPRQIPAGQAGVWATGFAALLLTMLFMLGFSYGLELAQALFFLALPMCLLALMRVRVARRIHERGLEDGALVKALMRHRGMVQLLGMISVFFTVLWGMWHSLTVGVLGN